MFEFVEGLTSAERNTVLPQAPTRQFVDGADETWARCIHQLRRPDGKVRPVASSAHHQEHQLQRRAVSLALVIALHVGFYWMIVSWHPVPVRVPAATEALVSVSLSHPLAEPQKPPSERPRSLKLIIPVVPRAFAPPQFVIAAAEPDQTPPRASAPATQTLVAPAKPVRTQTSSNAVAIWERALLKQLEHFKIYPAIAQARRQQGIAYVHFVMDRNGRVLSATVVKSSGFEALDDEALAVIHRAEPLPVPPSELAGNSVELDIPVEFFLR